MAVDDGKFIPWEEHQQLPVKEKQEPFDWEFQLLYLAKAFPFLYL